MPEVVADAPKPAAASPAPVAAASPTPAPVSTVTPSPAPAATPAAVSPAPAADGKPAGAAPASEKSLLADTAAAAPIAGGAEAKPGETAAPAKTGEAAPAAAPAKTGDAAAPEFKLTTPDKSPLAAATLERVTAWAKDAKLPQEQAQKLVDQLHAESVTAAEAAVKRQTDDYQALYKTWGDQIKADKEAGGDKLAVTLDQAKRALRVFASPEERAFLDNTPFGNHPILVKILSRMGARVSEDGFIGGAGNPAPQKSPAQIAYGVDHAKPSSFR